MILEPLQKNQENSCLVKEKGQKKQRNTRKIGNFFVPNVVFCLTGINLSTFFIKSKDLFLIFFKKSPGK